VERSALRRIGFLGHFREPLCLSAHRAPSPQQDAEKARNHGIERL
jgi:hypothetical protein